MIAQRNKNIHSQSYLRSRHIKYANELSKCERFLVKHMLNSSTFSFYEIQISICVLIVFETRKHQHYVKIWQHTHSLNMNLVDPLMCILYVLCEVSFLLWGVWVRFRSKHDASLSSKHKHLEVILSIFRIVSHSPILCLSVFPLFLYVCLHPFLLLLSLSSLSCCLL